MINPIFSFRLPHNFLEEISMSTYTCLVEGVLPWTHEWKITLNSLWGELIYSVNQCVQLEFIPDIWTEYKAIFIPKDRTHSKAKPLCLAKLFFKLLEKHIQYFLEINNIYPNKLSKCQHGFGHNRSTLTPLCEVASYIEEASDSFSSLPWH